MMYVNTVFFSTSDILPITMKFNLAKLYYIPIYSIFCEFLTVRYILFPRKLTLYVPRNNLPE